MSLALLEPLTQNQGQTPFTGYAPVIFDTLGTDNTLDSYNSWADVTANTKSFSLDLLGKLNPQWHAEDKTEDSSSSSSLRGSAPESFVEVASVSTGYSTISGGIALITDTVEALLDHPRPFLMKHIDTK